MALYRSQLLTWLSPLEPGLRHRDIRGHRVKDVGEWLLQTEKFRSWYAGSGGSESDDAVLFCYGDPGVGKTYISSLVIDRLRDRARGQNVTIACFYFDFAAQKEQSPASVLGVLLKQVVGRLGEVPEEVGEAYEYRERAIGGRGPNIIDAVEMLQTTTSRKRTFICIDALDECAEGHRKGLLDSLIQTLRRSPGTRIFVTGRPRIRPEIERRLAGRVASICISARRDDILGYVRTRLGEDTNPDAMDSSLEAGVLRKIAGDISKIFLLVSLNINAVLGETTIRRRRQKLSTMTDELGLGDAYGAAICLIKGQGGEKARLGMATLMWVSHAERPLKANELCNALAIEIGSPNLETNNVPSIGMLLASCQGLVAVEKEASTVRLIHFTLQEYLRAHPELFGSAHATLAETCLSYLNSQQVKALPINFSPNIWGIPFLEYSSLYWGVHAKENLSDCAKLLALKLFEDYNSHISSIILLKAQEPYSDSTHFGNRSQFNGLHCASIFGIVEIVASLVQAEGYNINWQEYVGNTPLVLAAWNGHEEVVRLLLGRDYVSPIEIDVVGHALLRCAAGLGHEGVVKVLLERDDVDPDRQDGCGRTPLWWAADNGQQGVVKILLGRDSVNPDKPDRYDQTPLCRSAWNGYEEVVKMLLGRCDVNPEKFNVYGQTPLTCAAWKGHEGVVKLLLRRDDVGPNTPDGYSRTPLWCAAENGHEVVVKILLRQDNVNPGIPNEFGQTPLTCAAWKGHEGVVKILLGREDINPDRPDGCGRTPLSCAAENGHERVVKLLLGRGDVNLGEPGEGATRHSGRLLQNLPPLE